MDDEKLWLPDLLRRMTDDLGVPVALGFGAEFGGRPLHLPKAAGPDHKIAKACGLAVLEWLLRQQRGGEVIMVPMGPKSAYNKRINAIRSMINDGVSASLVAQVAECHIRTVYRHRKALRARQGDDRQGALNFGDGEVPD